MRRGAVDVIMGERNQLELDGGSGQCCHATSAPARSRVSDVMTKKPCQIAARSVVIHTVCWLTRLVYHLK